MLALMGLVGCSNHELDQAKRQVAQCSAVLAQAEYEIQRLSSLEGKSREALRLEARARAQVQTAVDCDWLIPVCPTRMVEPGRKLMAEGFVAAPTPGVMLGKMLAFAAVTLASGLGLFFGWMFVVSPSREKLRLARETIENTKAEAEKAVEETKKRLKAVEKRVQEAEDEHERVKRALRETEKLAKARKLELDQALEELDDASEALTKLIEQQKSLERAIEVTKKMKDAGNSL